MAAPLNESQLKIFKRKLKDRFMALRREISAELLRSDKEKYADLAGRVHDPGDESLADLLVDLKLASVGRHVQEIRDIDAALIRIAERSYGSCCDCGQPIGIERLMAYPTARRCLICQNVHERTFAHGNQPTL